MRVVHTALRQTPGEDPKPIRRASRAQGWRSIWGKNSASKEDQPLALGQLSVDVDHLGHSIIMVLSVHQVLTGGQHRTVPNRCEHLSRREHTPHKIPPVHPKIISTVEHGRAGGYQCNASRSRAGCAVMGAGSSTRGLLHCIAAHEIPESGMGGGGLGRGGSTASRSGPSHGRAWPSTVLSNIGEHGSANISVRDSHLLWSPTRHVVSPRAAHSASGVVTSRCQKHSSIASRPPWLGARREGTSKTRLPISPPDSSIGRCLSATEQEGRVSVSADDHASSLIVRLVGITRNEVRHAGTPLWC